jgi:hypothetical protein
MPHRTTRRELAVAASALGAASFRAFPAAAQSASPETGATPADEDDFVERIAGFPPDYLLAVLQTTPVSTPLFPESYGKSMVSTWEDDADLEGSLGGAVVGADQAPIMLAFLVFPDQTAAIDRLTQMAADSEEPTVETTLLGYPGITFGSMFGPRTIIQVETVHVWGFGMPILTDKEMENPENTTPDDAYRFLLTARSVLHTAIGLDHLHRVVVTG